MRRTSAHECTRARARTINAVMGSNARAPGAARARGSPRHRQRPCQHPALLPPASTNHPYGSPLAPPSRIVATLPAAAAAARTFPPSLRMGAHEAYRRPRSRASLRTARGHMPLLPCAGRAISISDRCCTRQTREPRTRATRSHIYAPMNTHPSIRALAPSHPPTRYFPFIKLQLL